jgi:3-hydroxyacyl-[acyl-carrier-protein] dehydratase
MSIFGNKTSVSLSIERIMELLPHRYPFLLIDRIESLDFQSQTVIAIKNVTTNEPFFQGHFPKKPIMPGVLIIEAMAQASGVYALEADKTLQGSLPFFISIENAKFRLPVVPGDVLRIEGKVIKSRGALSKFECFAYVDGKLVTEAILTAKIML